MNKNDSSYTWLGIILAILGIIFSIGGMIVLAYLTAIAINAAFHTNLTVFQCFVAWTLLSIVAMLFKRGAK